MKTCFKCGLPKDDSEFYKHPQMADGRLNKCKECTKVDVKNNYAANRESQSNYERERGSQGHRKAYKADAQRKHRRLNPEKAKARAKLNNAVRDGKIKRLPCVYCGSPKSQGHHSDYSKPLDVVWACFKCHREHEHGQVVVAQQE